MKRIPACLAALCITLMLATSAFAQSGYPAKTDVLLFRNFLGEMHRLEVEVTSTEFHVYTDEFENGDSYVMCAYNPADDVFFIITYVGGAAGRYSAQAKISGDAQVDSQRVKALMAFALTFYDNVYDTAMETVQLLMTTGEEEENGGYVSSMEKDGVIFEYRNTDGFISLSCMP